MKSTSAVIFALASMLVLSGCIADPEPDPVDTGTEEPDPSTDVSGNETDLDDSVPEVNLTITASNLSGDAPLTVVFDLESTSPYASYLDWTFDANGDGTPDETGYGLPAAYNFTFAEPGDYTASLTAADPEERTTGTTLDLVVSEPSVPELPEPIVFNGTATGVLGARIPYEFNLTVPVNNITVTFEVSTTGFDYDFYLTNPDDKVFKAENENDPTGTVAPQAEPPIVVDDAADLVFGTWILEAGPFLSFEGEYTMTVTFN